MTGVEWVKWPWILAATGWVVVVALLVHWRGRLRHPGSVATLRTADSRPPEEQIRSARRSVLDLLAKIRQLPESARQESLARLAGREGEAAQVLLARGEVDEGGLYRERRGYVTVWWITLESYSSGFILAGHCGVAGRESGRGDYCGLYGVTVEDDLGQVYLSQGASGGELGTRLSFVPGLDPRARQVRVTLRSAILVSSEEPHRDPRSPRARPTHTEESLLDQPWAFDIPLEAPADGAASR